MDHHSIRMGPLQVQGVFFRDNTKQKADSIGVTGFCRNTDNNTVAGEIQVQSMMFDNADSRLSCNFHC